MRPFISYARKDLRWALRICADLRENRIEPWLDKVDLVPGLEWEAQIRNAVAKSSHFIMLLSRHSVSKTGFVQSEIHQAMTQLDRRPPGRIFVIPVRLDKCRPDDERINRLQRIDLFEDYDAGIAQLIKSLRAAARRRTVKTTTPPSPVRETATVRPSIAARPEKDGTRMVHYSRGPGSPTERITREERDAQVASFINTSSLRAFMDRNAHARSLEEEIAAANGRPRVAKPSDGAIETAVTALKWADIDTVGALENELETNRAAVVKCASTVLADQTLPIAGCTSLISLACVSLARHGESARVDKVLENSGIRARGARESAVRTILERARTPSSSPSP